MEFERLSLEIAANKAGLRTVVPRTLRGVSSVEHRFDLLFSDGERYYAFDFLDSVEDIDVVRAYAKKFDTGAAVNIICRGERVSEAARSLALVYSIRILSPEATESYFALEKASPDARRD